MIITWVFCAFKIDGSVVVWGNEIDGGDSSSVQHLLESNVKSVHATEGAFCVLKNDGNVVVWGYEDEGGDNSSVKHLEK